MTKFNTCKINWACEQPCPYNFWGGEGGEQFLDAVAFTTILCKNNDKHKIRRPGTSSLECIHNSIICCLSSLFNLLLLYSESAKYQGTHKLRQIKLVQGRVQLFLINLIIKLLKRGLKMVGTLLFIVADVWCTEDDSSISDSVCGLGHHWFLVMGVPLYSKKIKELLRKAI